VEAWSRVAFLLSISGIPAIRPPASGGFHGTVASHIEPSCAHVAFRVRHAGPVAGARTAPISRIGSPDSSHCWRSASVARGEKTPSIA